MGRVILMILTLFIHCFLFSTTEKDKTYDRLKMLVRILEHVKTSYVEEVDEDKLIYSAASGMLRALDRYSAFLEPRVREEMEIETTGKYGGLGIKISLSQDRYIQIVTPFPGTPAYRKGLSPGDKIIKIEGEDIKGIKLEDAVKKLRGAPGTKVNITVLKKDAKEPIDMTLTREEIRIPVLSSKLFPDNIGYIKLNEFNQNTVPELESTIKKLKSKGMNSLILDLRYNPGGLLDVAKDVVGLFLGDKKLIVYTKGRRPDSNREYYSKEKAPFMDIPMIVLINEGSASGSEIVAGALQDHRRALIIGTTTFGKASVQSVYKLENDCALKLTTAKYYTPSGRCIEKDPKTGIGGIVPDFIVTVPPEVEKKLRETEIYYPDEARKEKIEKVKEVKDPVIEKAIDILRGYNFFMKR